MVKGKQRRKKLTNEQQQALGPLPAKRALHSTAFCFGNGVQLTSLIPKKNRNVTLLSTCHQTEELDDGKERKPKTIMDYSKTKGGVDTFDKMVRNYSCTCKCDRCWITLFYNMLDAATLAVYRQYEIMHPDPKKKTERRENFLKELAFELPTPHVLRRHSCGVTSAISESMSHAGFPIPPRITPLSDFPRIITPKDYPVNPRTGKRVKNDLCHCCKLEPKQAGKKERSKASGM